MTPEFSRHFALDSLGGEPREAHIEATVEECAALARRFDLIAIDALSATARLSKTATGYLATGRLETNVVQSCVATASPVPASVIEDFTIRFTDDAPTDADEIELEAGDLDEMTHDGSILDLGEAVAQTLALALDPFPRAPRAEEVLRAAGVVGEDDVERGAFAALKGLLERP